MTLLEGAGTERAGGSGLVNPIEVVNLQIIFDVWTGNAECSGPGGGSSRNLITRSIRVLPIISCSEPPFHHFNPFSISRILEFGIMMRAKRILRFRFISLAPRGGDAA
jgi:hypothetical protein